MVSDTCFWIDWWLGNTLPKHCCLVGGEHKRKVHNAQVFIVNLKASVTEPSEVADFFNLRDRPVDHRIQAGISDNFLWKWSPNGLFTVKSM